MQDTQWQQPARIMTWSNMWPDCARAPSRRKQSRRWGSAWTRAEMRAASECPPSRCPPDQQQLGRCPESCNCSDPHPAPLKLSSTEACNAVCLSQERKLCLLSIFLRSLSWWPARSDNVCRCKALEQVLHRVQGAYRCCMLSPRVW